MSHLSRASARGDRESGSSLIELLVVLLITTILAGIAIPVYLQQRTIAFRTDLISALKTANVVAIDFSIDQGGSYTSLDGADGTTLADLGYPPTEHVYFALSATVSDLCVLAAHASLPHSDDWKVATFDTSKGAPSSSDECISVSTPPVPGSVEPEPDAEPSPSTSIESDPEPSPSTSIEPEPEATPDDEGIIPNPASSPVLPLPETLPLPRI